MTPLVEFEEDPASAHRRLCDQRRKESARFESWDRRIGDARLVVFLLVLGAGVLAFWTKSIDFVWVVPPVLTFVALVVAHDSVDRKWRRARRAAAFHERGLARVEGRWAGLGEPGTRYLDEDHPYAADLDLFGPGSLFQRLSTARTRVGEDTLASWLKDPASPERIRWRQEAQTELRGRLDLREDMALLGEEAGAGIDVDSVIAWAKEPSRLSSKGLEVLAHVLGTLGLILLVGWLADLISVWAFLVVVALEIVFSIGVAKRVRHVAGHVDRAGHDLSVLSQVLERIERESFQCSALRELRERLDQKGALASRRIARVCWIISLMEYRKNAVFALFGAVMLWTTRLAYLIERWRVANGQDIERWLAIVGEFEALCSLAAFAFEEVNGSLPEFTEGASPSLEAAGLGHPLLPVDQCVVNDVSLGGRSPRLLLVSGSNMSGKSTLLRTIGVNVVLAQAGTIVRAKRFRLTPLMPGATLRVQDSLRAGRSRFYAEVARLRQLLDLASERPPLLFLLDEVLHGTNSHDRLIGAEAVLRKLLELGALGLATTHDLALTAIAGSKQADAINVHFQDMFENGKMTFDYKMRLGVVGHSNALELMRSVGIDV